MAANIVLVGASSILFPIFKERHSHLLEAMCAIFSIQEETILTIFLCRSHNHANWLSLELTRACLLRDVSGYIKCRIRWLREMLNAAVDGWHEEVFWQLLTLVRTYRWLQGCDLKLVFIGRDKRGSGRLCSSPNRIVLERLMVKVYYDKQRHEVP